MKIEMIVSILLVGAVAPLAQAATATNPSPANFGTAATHTPTLTAFLAKPASEKFFSYTTRKTAAREVLADDYRTNGIVRLSWSGTSGESTVTVVRLSDSFTQTLAATNNTVELLAPEIGRNYKWWVTNKGDTSATWYFYTDGAAPRVIPRSLACVGNCRDLGGWVTADGQHRVRQGLGFRNDHNADFGPTYAMLKPFWTDIVKVKTDMDLRDTMDETTYYCDWEMDRNVSGHSPYAENWWEVCYWNVLRAGSYGRKMLAYRNLIDGIANDAKLASHKTWKMFADAGRLPIVVHCSQGRDRTGTVAFVLLGALGVGLDDLYTDWALTDYADWGFPQKESQEGSKTIVDMYNALRGKYSDSSYPTLQAKCEKLLTDIGVGAGEIACLKSYLLEPIETPLTAAPNKRSVAIPHLKKTSVLLNNAAPPEVTPTSSDYAVDFGGGDFSDIGKFFVTVTLKEPAMTQWADGTTGPKVFPYSIKHNGNTFVACVRSWIKGDTEPKIMIGQPRYFGKVWCDYTEDELNDLAPGTYTATFTADDCDTATSSTRTAAFTVYPAGERADYTYEYADLDEAYFKTDYVPDIHTDTVEVRVRDLDAGNGGGFFSCAPYPSAMTLFKTGSSALLYYQGTQKPSSNVGSMSTSTIYTITANGRTCKLYDETTKQSHTASVTLDKVNPTPGPAFIGIAAGEAANSGVRGVPANHAPHRLYHVKAWNADGTLLRHFVPCVTTGHYVMLYDKETKKIYPFSSTVGETGTVSLGGTATKVEGGDPEPDPPVGPTVYGDPDTKCVTYAWKGGNGPWEYTTNWTAGGGATYGIPNAQSVQPIFPEDLTAATVCTVSQNHTVSNIVFGSPNLTLRLDNATVTAEGPKVGDGLGVYDFGKSGAGHTTLAFAGANAGLVATRGYLSCYIGSRTTGSTGACTVRFEVPATGWETRAPLQATGDDAKVRFQSDVSFDIDATALGVPATDVTNTVLLAYSQNRIRFDGYASNDEGFAAACARAQIACAEGAKGTLVLDGEYLKLAVTALSTPAPDVDTFAYLQFCGASAKSGVTFNTGYRPHCATTRVEMKFRMTDATTQSSGLFTAGPTSATVEGATYPAGEPKDLLFGVSHFYSKGGQRTPRLGVLNGRVDTSAWVGFEDATADHVLSFGGNVFTFDGVTTNLPYVATNAWASGPLVIGAANFTDVYSNYAKMRLGYFRIYENEFLRHEYVAATNAAGTATLYDTVTKTWLTPRSGDGGLALVGGGTGDPAPVVPQTPEPFDGFDAAHTVIFYGDSSIWGENAGYPDDVTPAHANTELSAEELARPNYFGGRLRDYPYMVRRSIPFYFSGLVSTNYNVINQARSGMCVDFITGIYGSMPAVADYPVTLDPTAGKFTDYPNGLAYADPDYAFGKEGYKYWSKYNSGLLGEVHNWRGAGTPPLPLWTKPASDGWGTICGTLGGVPVRIDANYNVQMRVTRLTSSDEPTVIPAGAAFVSDNQRLFQDAIHVLEFGGNVSYENREAGITYLAQRIAALGNARYVMQVPSCRTETEAYDQTTPTAYEQEFLARFGEEHCFCMRLELARRGVEVAHQLGYTAVTNILATGEGGLMQDVGVHFNYQGNHVAAYLWKEKLDALGWLEPAPGSGLALLAPTNGAKGVAVTRPGHDAFFALDRDARWAQVDDPASRLAMVETSSFPQDVAFAWQGGMAPYTLTLRRTRDNVVVKTVTGLASGMYSATNLEIGRAYTWTVTDATNACATGTFTTAYADQRFLRVAASNAYDTVKVFAGTASADFHKGYLPNFRDVGGLFTADGTRRVRQGVVYRSFCFDSTIQTSYTPLGVDLETVTNALGIKTDLDLRAASEVANIVAHGGTSPLGPSVAWINCQTLPYDVESLGAADEQALRVFADASKLPAVFHCTAGQDRTGTLAMLLGAILDLDEEDIEKAWSASCFFQKSMDKPGDTGFQTHRVKRFFGSYAKYGRPGDTFAVCVRNAIKEKTSLTEADFEAIRANLLEETDTDVTRPVKATVDVPKPNAVERAYDGTAQTTYLRSNPRYTVAMANDAVQPGNYPVTLTLVDPNVCAWSDGKTESKTVFFTITGEAPTPGDPTPAYDPTTDTLTFKANTTYPYATNATYGATKAAFEDAAAMLVANGAAVTVSNAYLGASGNTFTVKEGGVLELTAFTATQVAGKTWTFDLDRGTVKLSDTFTWQSTDTLRLRLANGSSFTGCSRWDKKTAMKTAIWDVSLADSVLDFSDYNLSVAGCSFVVSNSTVKGEWGFVIGSKTATLELSGAEPFIRGSNGPITIGAKTSVVLRPEPGWSSVTGRLHSTASASKASAKITLAAGTRFNVDVTKLAGGLPFTFCLLSAPTAGGVRSITLPSADKVTVSGAGAADCDVAFSKSADDRYVYVSVTAKGAAPLPTVDDRPVDPAKVFEAARVTKPIVYPTAPTLTGTAAVDQRIAYGGVATDVPVYYTATLSGTTVLLAFNDRAKPLVADGEATRAFVLEGGQVRIHLENTWSKLYYALSTADAIEGPWTTTGAFEQGKADFAAAQPADSAHFYRVIVKDVQ